MKQISGAESENWTMKVENNFTLIEYHGDITPEEGKAIVENWTPLISDNEVDTHVLHLDADDHFDNDTFDTVSEAGALGLDHGVDRWAIVARKTKSMAISSKLPDDIETYESEDLGEALEWARN
ncbi:STAS/SEC14 domain-containing protein [Halorussus litoreus]|uniref:STAS/SEC14 domain-containing protein n=1 Tax=Halorussus litoreus TaxID=1710536 RepID=UPI000E249C9B|nr:STAS/SEC14 domain-containing protein [Halorussus litoreus]